MHLRRSPRLLVVATTALAVCSTVAPASAQDAGFAAREAANFSKVGQAPAQQATDSAFVARWQQQSLVTITEFMALGSERALATTGNVCREWAQQCTGDPFRYPGVDPFYDPRMGW